MLEQAHRCLQIRVAVTKISIDLKREASLCCAEAQRVLGCSIALLLEAFIDLASIVSLALVGTDELDPTSLPSPATVAC